MYSEFNKFKATLDGKFIDNTKKEGKLVTRKTRKDGALPTLKPRNIALDWIRDKDTAQCQYNYFVVHSSMFINYPIIADSSQA